MLTLGNDIKNRNLAAFLEALRSFESGITVSKFNFYVENFNTKIINYPKVESPGRILRDYNNGKPCFELITIKEYFSRIGVLELFDKKNEASLYLMQYHSINPLGFIGYQIGEAILISTGYYQPCEITMKVSKNESSCYRYYAILCPDELWSHGVREKLIDAKYNEKYILTTDINCWKGRFSGKNGIFSREDLKQPEKQEKVMSDIIKYNINLIKCKLETRKQDLDSVLQKTWKIENTKSQSKRVIKCSLSGIIACSHLCGAEAAYQLLIDNKSSKDEFGTPILQYMDNFYGYNIEI